MTLALIVLAILAFFGYRAIQARAQARHRRAALARVADRLGVEAAYAYGRRHRWREVSEWRPLFRDGPLRSLEIDDDYQWLLWGGQVPQIGEDDDRDSGTAVATASLGARPLAARTGVSGGELRLHQQDRGRPPEPERQGAA